MRGNLKFRALDRFAEEPAVMPEHKLVIAVDGQASSGKGTLAQKLAERLDCAFLDTGALYRAVGWLALENDIPAENGPALDALLDTIDEKLTPAFLTDSKLRSEAAADAASRFSAIPAVRAALLAFQRNFAQNPPSDKKGAVLDGRDIGTVVCPAADIKIFVTASVEARAQRRVQYLEKQGFSADLAEVEAGLKARDARDSGRDIAPMKPAKDAFILDNSALNIKETVDQALTFIRAQLIQSPTQT